MKIVHRQTSDSLKQLRLELGDDILKRVFAEVSEIHKGRDAGGTHSAPETVLFKDSAVRCQSDNVEASAQRQAHEKL